MIFFNDEINQFEKLAYVLHSLGDIWMSLEGQVGIGMGERTFKRSKVIWYPHPMEKDAKREEAKSQTVTLVLLHPTILAQMKSEDACKMRQAFILYFVNVRVGTGM